MWDVYGWGRTALMMACRQPVGGHEAVKLLLDEGDNAPATDYRGT